MTAIDNTPKNLNYLSPLNFKFQLKKAPHVNFFIQKVNIPAISLKNATYANPFVNIPLPGEHIDYTPLQITFKVDEHLQNYLEIHNWIVGLGKPRNFEQYASLERKGITTGEGIVSDISLQVLSNTKVHNYEVTFIDAHPIDLSGVQFNTTDTDVNYLEATASFRYTYYTINKI